MEQLLREYRKSLEVVRNLQENASDEDKEKLRSMASDLQYAIDWIRLGHRPGHRRGIERRAAYQREKPFDPILMQQYYRSEITFYKEDVISSWDRQRIEDALSVLTEREKDMYLMSRGHSLSYEQIANYLHISRSSVQTTIERAEKKIVKKINNSLFSLAE